MKYLAAPWRWPFISTHKEERGCLFCAAAAEKSPDSLLCYRGEHFFVMLNKYPYSTGHLLIAPLLHVSSPSAIPLDQVGELWEILSRSLQMLQELFQPQGFNIGGNMGKVAGAGVPDHFHLHVVPRWEGDANFMAVLGHTKVLSYDMAEVLRQVRSCFAQPKAK